MTSNEAGVSGDNYSITELSGRKLALTLADGMGSGPRARRESGIVVELLEQSLDAGFGAKAAIGLINAAIATGNEECHPVTVDTCVVDRYLGVARFIKLGAASTFIKRDGWVEIIKSTTLPIGVLVKIIQNIDIKVPDIIAQNIMDAVLAGGRSVADDMSILVTGVFDTAVNMY